MARKILLADDSVTAQNMGRRILSDAGYDVITVNNGSAALKKIPDEKPDLLILDVYMPGYGGVEVCQRIKENPETAHIPVLLTVGKLEPFKADEARRVHADAHLVKPFEASELLIALTKLEDKIVPRAEPRPANGATKSNERAGAKVSAQATASRDAREKEEKETKEKGAKFGDSLSGWKDRLKIPRLNKAVEPEAAPPVKTSNTAFRNLEHSPESQQEPAISPVSAGAGGDITVEEIAAIAAAAAACGERTDSVDLQPVAVEEVSPAYGFVSEATEAGADAGYPSAAAAAPLTAEEAVPSVEPAMDSDAASAAMVSNSASDAAEKTQAVEKIDDAEVAAALETLAPVNGSGAVDHAYEAGHFLDSAVEPHEVSPGERYASEHAAATEPRWTAREVAVNEAEAACILEQEMDKAYAALTQSGLAGGASAEPERGEAAAWSLPDEHFSSSYSDHGTPAGGSSEGIAQAAASEESPLGDAFGQEAQSIASSDFPSVDLTSPESPSPEIHPVAEMATTETAGANEDLPSRRQTWADMAWGDTPPQPFEPATGFERQEEQPQAEAAAAAEDEPIFADSGYTANYAAEALAPSETVVAAVEAETSTTEWTSHAEEQPQADAIAAAEIAAAENDAASAEGQFSEPPAAAEISKAFSGAASATANWTQSEAQAEPVDAVASAYETRAVESESTGETSEPPIMEAIAAVADEAPAEGKPQAAFAAAASAGFGFRSITHSEPVDEPTSPAAATGAPVEAHEPSPEREAELAAAWAHWKQIRESIASPQFTSQAAEAAAAEVRESQPEALASAAPEAAPETEADPSAIASIVDSVLAEMRPKLVAEIARKLGKEKK